MRAAVQRVRAFSPRSGRSRSAPNRGSWLGVATGVLLVLLTPAGTASAQQSGVPTLSAVVGQPFTASALGSELVAADCADAAWEIRCGRSKRGDFRYVAHRDGRLLSVLRRRSQRR